MLVELTDEEYGVIKSSILEKWAISAKNYEKDSFEIDRKNNDLCSNVLVKLDIANLDKDDVVLKMKDLLDIKSLAVTEFNALSLPLFISKIRVEQRDIVNIAFIRSLVMWLNNRNLLKTLIRLDFTDDSVEYDSIED